jgi:hypothetical protein
MSWLGTRAWLRQFFEARGKQTSIGSPLYAYRTNDSEFAELRSLIRTVSRQPVNPDRLSQDDCAVFCLYAAEWWRRNHEAGPWKWEGILEEIAWAGTPLLKLYPIVFRGLEFWKRNLLRTRDERNLFLVTLACEGGLPLKLLGKESARLRTFFREALEEFQYFHRSGETPAAIVARLSERLPRSLRQEIVYQLAGTLVQRIWELQQKLGDSKNPVEALNRIEPNWRDELPLRVEDVTARLLLNNLIEDASRVAAAVSGGPQIVTNIRQDGEGWLLEAEFKTPPRMTESEVVQLLTVRSQEIPPRLQLELVDSDGDRTVCGILSRFSTTPDSAFVIESVGKESIGWSGLKACV